MMRSAIEIILTCPPPEPGDGSAYRARLRRWCRHCEKRATTGVLLHAGHGLPDAWVTAQVVLEASATLLPVITLRPAQLHPYEAARKLAALAALYGRVPAVVLAAGESRSELASLGQDEPHAARYGRLREYGELLTRLLTSRRPLVHKGAHYRLDRPRPPAPAPPDGAPRLFVSGCSVDGRATAQALGAERVVPALEDAPAAECIRVALAVGATAHEARVDARAMLSTDPSARLARRLDRAWSDSRWQRGLQQAAERLEAPDDGVQARGATIWLEPFRQGAVPCPVVLGDTRAVARALRGFLDRGARTLFLHAPVEGAALDRALAAVDRAWRRHRSALAVTA